MVERRAAAGEDIGRGIRKLRLQRKWKQAVLAHEAGMTVATISLVETGKTNPTIYDIERIAKALDTTVTGLIVASRKSLLHKDQDLIDYVGKAVRNRRLELGLTKTELGQRADLLPQYISTTENCRRLVGLKNLVKLANALEADLSCFIPNQTELIGNITYDENKMGPAFKKLRSKKNISRTQIVAKSGVSPTHIANIENGSQIPRLNTVISLCLAIDVPLHELFAVMLD